MAHHQQRTTDRPSGRTTRQHSRPTHAELPTHTNTITSSPETSSDVDIDKISHDLGSVDLQDDNGVAAIPARTYPITIANSITAGNIANESKAAANKSAAVLPLHHQEPPPIVRRSRRGERAISHDPQVGRYRVEITSSERLWCGKFALGISTEQQLGTRLTVEHFDEIFAGEESTAFNEKHGWAGVEDTARNNFYDEQLDFVLRVWGRRREMRLQLGVVRDFEGVFVNRALGDEETAESKGERHRTTLWIHNDNAMLLGRPYNHYSGISILDKPC